MLRVGIIGFGGMGKGRLRYYRQIPEARVEAIADVRCAELQGDEALADLLELPPAALRWFDDYRALLASGAVDVVDICLPTYCHREAAVAALEAGVPVLCEKPMALTVADCDAMVATCRRTGTFLMVAQCIRFWPEYQYLADLLHSGEAGKLLSLRLTRQGPLPGAGRGWMPQARYSGGAILDLHIHDVDYCQYLLGLPRRVYAQGGMSSGAEGGYDYVLTNWDYGPGLQVSAAAQWTNLRIPFVARYEARFEGAYLDFDSGRKPTLLVYRPGAAVPETPSFAGPDAYENELRYFLQCVLRGEEPLRCPPESSRNAVALVHAAIASIQRQALVEIAEFAR